MGTKFLAGVTLAVATALIAFSGRATAQIETAKAGPEHKVLEPLVGNFAVKMKVWEDPAKPPQESQGTMVRKWILNGLFVQEDFSGKLFGSDFNGMGFFGFDSKKKKYVGAWLDTMSGGIMTSEGTYDAGTKTFHTTTEEVDPKTGQKSKMRDMLRIVDNDHQLQEMFMTPPEGGKEFKMMEMHYTRKK